MEILDIQEQGQEREGDTLGKVFSAAAPALVPAFRPNFNPGRREKVSFLFYFNLLDDNSFPPFQMNIN